MSQRSRIPPGQHETRGFPVLHVGEAPEFDAATWRLEVEGLVENPLSLPHEEVRALPRVVSVSDFHCVTGWSRLDARWEGVPFRELIARARPLPQARYATIECDGGYSTSLPLEELIADDVLLAYRLDGQELAPEHGHPLRLVVPAKYAYKAAKWARRVRLTERQELGYWELRRYSNTADPWTQDRYS